ncbi:MAG TPA: hypothetical protein VH682_29330 [Gemmataceae bacterium]|jgi:hypothetical protein
MPRHSSKSKLTDRDQDAEPTATLQESTPTTDSPANGKNPAAVALGRLGGKKGGEARAKKLTAERRREIAKKAAEARWKKKKRS